MEGEGITLIIMLDWGNGKNKQNIQQKGMMKIEQDENKYPTGGE